MYGPNFSLDEDPAEGDSLFAEALENAKVKADTVARASGRKLGSILSITEGASGGSSVILSRIQAGGGGGGMEPGSATVSKSVTVVFELR